MALPHMYELFDTSRTAAAYFTHTVLTAAPPDENIIDRDPEWGKAAPAGILVWIFLGVALFFLIKSMNKHLKRVPKDDKGRADTSLVASEEGAGWVPRPPRGKPANVAAGAAPTASTTQTATSAAATSETVDGDEPATSAVSDTPTGDSDHGPATSHS